MSAATITFGDVAENHAHMQKIGELHAKGYSLADLERLAARLAAEGVATELVRLDAQWAGNSDFAPAAVLIIRRGVQHVLGSTGPLQAEHAPLAVDKKALMRGRVVNKRARWNLCFDDIDQEPDYEAGKGRIVAYSHLPCTQRLRETIAEWTGDVLLKGEANYYYDIAKCGIGYHGDAERRKVFAVRFGASHLAPLYYQWYRDSSPVGDRIELVLNDGDMYVMSEKSVGFDWLKKKVPTLRHATGCAKFTAVKD